MAERKVVTDNQLAALATDAEVATAVSNHEADTTAVHGITDTSALLTTSAAAAAYQPVDSDLTAIAALTTTSFGRGLLALADAAAGRTSLGAAATSHSHAESDVTNLTTDLAAKQPLDADLTSLAALTTTSYGRALLELANQAALQTAVGIPDLGIRLPTSMVSGKLVSVGIGRTGGTGAHTQSRCYYIPWLWIDRTRAFDQFVIYVPTAAASSVVRIGLYADGGGKPGNLITDFGTADTSTTGIKTITAALSALTAATYFVGVVFQGGAPSTPRVEPMAMANPVSASDAPWAILAEDGVTGALANAGTINYNVQANWPAVCVRTA